MLRPTPGPAVFWLRSTGLTLASRGLPAGHIVSGAPVCFRSTGIDRRLELGTATTTTTGDGGR